MKRLLVATALLLAATSGAALAQNAPVQRPPSPSANQTSQLIWNAMSATARAAATNPTAAQAATLDTNAALERYRMHDFAGARSAAIQALIDANRPAPSGLRPLRPLREPRGTVQTGVFPLAGESLGPVDADTFVAQARGSVQACRDERSPSTAAAATQLATATRDQRAGDFLAAQTAAKRAIDLCAPALRAINLRTP